MSQSTSTTNAFDAQMQEVIEAVQHSLKEGEAFFEQFGLNGDKVRTYLESISTPETHAQAQALMEEDMRAVEQEARAQLASINTQTATRTSPRKPRSMI